MVTSALFAPIHSSQHCTQGCNFQRLASR